MRGKLQVALPLNFRQVQVFSPLDHQEPSPLIGPTTPSSPKALELLPTADDHLLIHSRSRLRVQVRHQWPA